MWTPSSWMDAFCAGRASSPRSTTARQCKRRAKPPPRCVAGRNGRHRGGGKYDLISAGRSAIWLERGGAAELLPHEGGPVGDLLLGQAGDGGDPAWLAWGSEELRQEFRRARYRLRPFRLRRRPR